MSLLRPRCSIAPDGFSWHVREHLGPGTWSHLEKGREGAYQGVCGPLSNSAKFAEAPPPGYRVPEPGVPGARGWGFSWSPVCRYGEMCRDDETTAGDGGRAPQ